MAVQDTLQAIRPCRESQTGWTLTPAMEARNHTSFELNEHGPALSVFWSRRRRDGRRLGEVALAKSNAAGYRTVDQKNEPEGAQAGTIQSAPFGSKIGNQGIGSKRARTRWLTERIASLSKSSLRVPNQKTKTPV